jgi:hypothetical protein
MAKFETGGLGDLELTLKEIAEIPDEVAERMVSAGADVVARAQRQSISEHGLVNTGQLQSSIKKRVYKAKGKQKPYALVGPSGKRKDSNYTNNDAGFIQEFGAPGRNIKPTEWMRTAVERSADAVVNAEIKVWDEWITNID